MDETKIVIFKSPLIAKPPFVSSKNSFAVFVKILKTSKVA